MPDTRSAEELVAELWDREQIRQCLQRYARGLDRFDRDLVLSVFHPDCIEDHGKFSGNREEFASWAIDMHQNVQLSTQHCLLNHTCELDGDTAHTETYFLFASMNRKGKPLTLAGGRYIDRFEKRDGEWRIAARVTVRDWSNLDEIPDISDLSTMTSTASLLSDAERAFMNQGRGPARDTTDPSYDRPLEVDPARREAYLKLCASKDS